jgi:hypothetical protein
VFDGVKSDNVLKLNISNKSNSPKKKKKHQKLNKKYVVDLDVIIVN